MGYYEDEERRNRLRAGLAMAIVVEVERRSRILAETKSPPDPPDLYAIALEIFDHEAAAWDNYRTIILGALDAGGGTGRGLDRVQAAYRAVAKEIR